MRYNLMIERIGGREQKGPPSRVMMHKMLTRPGGIEMMKNYSTVREWVAEIGPGFSRKFLKGRYDCTHVDETGMRGIYVHFALEEGKVYEVCVPLEWGEKDRYFCTVKDGGLRRMVRGEVVEWLKRRWE